jgi:putative transposase
LGDLHAAYRNFFNGLKGKRANGQKLGPPRRKKKGAGASIRLTRNGFSLRDNGRLYLAKIGEVKVRWSRPLPATPSSVTIIRDATGRHYASFVVDVEDESLPEVDSEVGIDLGLSVYAIDSNGRKIASPKFFRRMQRRLRRAQRDLSRKQKGSANRRKAKLDVAKVHGKVRQRRADFIHQTTTRIIRDNQAVYVEDLAVKAMGSRKGRRGKSHSASSCGPWKARPSDTGARWSRWAGSSRPRRCARRAGRSRVRKGWTSSAYGGGRARAARSTTGTSTQRRTSWPQDVRTG